MSFRFFLLALLVPLAVRAGNPNSTPTPAPSPGATNDPESPPPSVSNCIFKDDKLIAFSAVIELSGRKRPIIKIDAPTVEVRNQKISGAIFTAEIPNCYYEDGCKNFSDPQKNYKLIPTQNSFLELSRADPIPGITIPPSMPYAYMDKAVASPYDEETVEIKLPLRYRRTHWVDRRIYPGPWVNRGMHPVLDEMYQIILDTLDILKNECKDN